MNLSLYKQFRVHIIILLLVLYIFNIVPAIGIGKIGTREIISIIALLIIFPKFINNKYYRALIIANWSQILISIIAAISNGTTDFWYVQFAIRNILYLNGALLIVSLLPPKTSFYEFVLFIVAAILVNCFVATICFFIPSAMDMLVTLQDLGDEDKINNTLRWSVRMIGLGCGNFYVGGIINGMGIISVFLLLVKNKIDSYLGVILLAILFFIGVFIARTTIIGLAIGLCYYFISAGSGKFVYFILISCLLLFAINYFEVFSSVNTSHAFEFFTLDTDSYQSSQTMESLSSMYSVEIDSKTLIIGDGLSKYANGKYYMHTDVGYLRNIFYFGIVGTIFGYFYYELRVLATVVKLSSELKVFVIFMFVFLLALNFKGLPDFNFFIFLIIAYYLNKMRTIKKIRYENSSYYRRP